MIDFDDLIFEFSDFDIFEHFKLCAELSWTWKKFYNLRTRPLLFTLDKTRLP